MKNNRIMNRLQLGWGQRLAVAGLTSVVVACAADRPAPVVVRTPPPGTMASDAEPTAPPPPAARVAQAPSGLKRRWADAPNGDVVPIRKGDSGRRPASRAEPARDVARESGDTPAVQVQPVTLGGAVAAEPPPASRTRPDTAPVAPVATAPTTAPTPATPPAEPPVSATRAEPTAGTEDSGARGRTDGLKAAGKGVLDGVRLAWPTAGPVEEGFNATGDRGVVMGGAPGTPIMASAEGRVIFSGLGPRGYGNLIIVKHEQDIVTVYANNRALLVKEGQTVKRGQKIAELGDSGAARPMLHFEIRRQGRNLDPLQVLAPR